MYEVALLKLSQDRIFRLKLRFFLHDSLMERWVEGLPKRINRFDLKFIENFQNLL